MTSLTPPAALFQTSSNVMFVEFRDPNHTPWNKLKGQVDSLLLMKVTKHISNKHVEFRTEELTTGPSGRVVSRVISTTMDYDQAKAIANFILDVK